MPQQHYRPQTYRSRDSVGYLIRRLYSLLLARFEGALAQADFTLTQWIVLAQLREGIARTASDLASDLDHDSGAITRVLDQLERRGFLQRRRSSRDRRVVELKLTPAGKAIAGELLPLVVDQTNAALAPLSKSEFLQLHGYLVRLLDHAQSAGAAGEPSTSRRRAAGQDGARRAAPRAPTRVAAQSSSKSSSKSPSKSSLKSTGLRRASPRTIKQ
jgi:DNA-binding MarR family transcriptional regulator